MPRPPTPVGAYGNINVTGDKVSGFVAETRFRMADGRSKRVARSGGTKSKAINRLKTALTGLADEALGGSVSSSTRMERLAELWLEEVATAVVAGDLADNTGSAYRGKVKNWIVPSIGELQAQEFTVMAAEGCVKRARTKCGYDTAKGVRTVLGLICAYGVRHGAMKTNPVDSVARMNRGEQKEVVALDRDQRIDLLKRIEAFAQEKQTDKQGRSLGERGQPWLDLADLIRVMLATGGRGGEALALDAADWHPKDQTLTLGHHLVRVTGKGIVRKPGRKGGKPPLILKVPSWAVPIVAARAGVGGPLFPAHGGGWQDARNANRRLTEALEGTGYEWVTGHVFRKTVDTVLDEAGLTVTEQADQLGNTPDVVERHYRRKRAANQRSADALEGMLGP